MTAPGRLAAALADRYRVERELGQGGMATVYLAHDLKHDRKVAIKVLRPELAATIGADRFLSEIRTVAALSHPNILPLFDSGVASLTTDAGQSTADSGLLFYVMPFIEGETLRARMTREKALPLEDALKLTREVADALAHAHAQGVVHRDIKPANVMADLTGDSVKVTDFGIARIADASRTRTGVVLGTPSFMSPEQMAGGDVDGRSDVYSLGAMLFQLLSGHLPFEADSMHALMTQIATEPAPDVRAWRPELPEALANVVSLALQKRPEVRYAGAAQLADDLRAIESMLAADVKM
jgi:serine/threonine-protein kinase